jgi:hypothetical protein
MRSKAAEFAPEARALRRRVFVMSIEGNSTMRAKRLTLQQRREIFSSLVATQDQGLMSVAESRKHVIEQFKITDIQLRQIEEEGLDKEWPPLNEEAAVAAV